VLCVVGVLTMLFSDEIVEREQLPPGEYYALTLFAISGMMLMAAATDLLVIFLALGVPLFRLRPDGHPAIERGRR
jgi:NADH-quinone oxidoreductase subunit N